LHRDLAQKSDECRDAFKKVRQVKLLVRSVDPVGVSNDANSMNRPWTARTANDRARDLLNNGTMMRLNTGTVGAHLRRVFAKLGVGSRAAIVASLIKKGNLKNPC
jgi:hypothetical protein